MDCFAMKENDICIALSGGICKGISCGFYKTKEEHRKSVEEANERLRKLPEHQQTDIADRYYGGKKEW